MIGEGRKKTDWMLPFRPPVGKVLGAPMRTSETGVPDAGTTRLVSGRFSDQAVGGTKIGWHSE